MPGRNGNDRNREFLKQVEEQLIAIQRELPPVTPSDPTALAHNDLLYSIRDLAQRNLLPENSLENLVAKIWHYLERLTDRGDVSWDDAEYHPMSELRDPSMEGYVVKLRVQLATFAEPVAVLGLDGLKHLATSMTFQDVVSADRMDSVPSINTALIQHIAALKHEHHVFDVLATVVLMPAGFGERFCLLVHDIRPSQTPLQMVQATWEEMVQARRTLQALEDAGTTIFDYLYDTVVRGLGLQGIVHASALADSLEAMIVQAFSDGMVAEKASGKLHTLIIGAPAVGKKLLTEAARVLNPAFQEAQPSKATVAGICSTAVQYQGVWHSKPGYLPLAHRGVFAIQDFHAVKNDQREKLFGVFNMVMEDGRAIDSTAAKQTHPALTSIHLDMNKRTDLFPHSRLQGETIVAKRLDDIRIPMTILSRFDFIIDIPRDTQRQLEIALTMYDQPGCIVGSGSGSRDQAAWARALQVLVAHLRTEHADVMFSEAIQQGMKERHAAFHQANATVLAQLPWLSDFQTRLSNSAFKFVAAYARMHNRREPLDTDIARAFRLIERKYNFLITLSQTLQIPETQDLPYRDTVTQWLHTRFAGRQMQTGAILQTYAEDFGRPLVRRTLERHLPHVAKRLRQGLWEFPL